MKNGFFNESFMGHPEKLHFALIKQRKKTFVPRRSGSYPAFWFLKSHILQRNSLKIQRENWYFSFLHFLAIFFSCPMVFDPMDQFVWSIRFFWYPYWHTVWHSMSYGIKCHEVCQYGYQKNRIDQTNWAKDFKIIHQKENLEKNPKN